MNIELKRGRKAVTKFLDRTYRDTVWSASRLQYLAGAAESALCHRQQPRPARRRTRCRQSAYPDCRSGAQAVPITASSCSSPTVRLTAKLPRKWLMSRCRSCSSRSEPTVPESHYIASDVDLGRLRHRIDGRLRHSRFRQTHATGQALSAAWPALTRLYRTHGAVRHRLWPRAGLAVGR